MVRVLLQQIWRLGHVPGYLGNAPGNATESRLGTYEPGTLYDHLGLDPTSGLAAVKQGLEIDPTNVFSQDRLVESYRMYGKCEEANDTAIRYTGRPFAEALVCLGRLDEAEPLLRESIKNDPGNVRAQSALAVLLAKKGDQNEAEAANSGNR